MQGIFGLKKNTTIVFVNVIVGIRIFDLNHY